MNENESFQTASELLEADHPHEITTLPNERVEHVTTQAEPKPACNYSSFELAEALRGPWPVDVVAEINANLSAIEASLPGHVHSTLYGVLMCAMRHGLQERVKLTSQNKTELANATC